RHAPVVDGGLRALGLELVEDARHLACLRLVEPELEGEKAQRSPHPEGGGAEEARSRRDPGRGLLPRGARGGRSRSRSSRDDASWLTLLSPGSRAGGCSRAGTMPRAVD